MSLELLLIGRFALFDKLAQNPHRAREVPLLDENVIAAQRGNREGPDLRLGDHGAELRKIAGDRLDDVDYELNHLERPVHLKFWKDALHPQPLAP